MKEPQHDEDTCLLTKKRNFAFFSIALCPSRVLNPGLADYKTDALTIALSWLVEKFGFFILFNAQITGVAYRAHWLVAAAECIYTLLE